MSRATRRRRAVPRPNSALDWAVRYAAPLLGIVGVTLYGVLRLAYVFFYMQLRTTPQEAGYGYVEILSSQLIGTVELVLLLTVTLLAVTLGGYGMRRLVLARLGRRPAPWRRSVARLALWSGVASVVVVLATLPTVAWLTGTEARKGYLVRNVYLLHTLRIPVLAVQAVPAAVAWSATPPPGLQNLQNRYCLLYLGQAAGTTVFYDVTTRESLRIPSAQVVISLQNIDSVPIGC
jgi:hypothetical protein